MYSIYPPLMFQRPILFRAFSNSCKNESRLTNIENSVFNHSNILVILALSSFLNSCLVYKLIDIESNKSKIKYTESFNK